MPDVLLSAIIDALKRLPLRPDVDSAHLEISALLLEFDVGLHPEKQSTTTQALEEVAACRKVVTALQDAVVQLSPRARAALVAADRAIHAREGKSTNFGLNSLGFLPLEGRLNPTAELLGEAADLLHVSKTGPERGRKRKAHASSLAKAAAKTYHELTGEKPTRRTDPIGGKDYGPFLDLVRTLFDLGRVDASAERFARLATESFQESTDEIHRSDS